MLWMKTWTIRSFEVGLKAVDGDFAGLLGPGRHRIFDPRNRVEVRIVSQRAPWLVVEDLDVIVRSGALDGRALVLDVKDRQRALVWIDGRFDRVVGRGLHAVWTGFREVRAEIVDASGLVVDHAAAAEIALASPQAVEQVVVSEGQQAVLLRKGRFDRVLEPGRWLIWKDIEPYQVRKVDTTWTGMDVAGQEIMTADKVTLRLNAVVEYRVAEAVRFVTAESAATLYRRAQLALRAVIGTRTLEALLGEKDAVAGDLLAQVAANAEELGVEVRAFGIRDVILPGEMKDILNRVTQAAREAEANLIARREETAAMRSQANTARLLENNPTLMRLRELEVLEKIASTGKLNIVLGEKGLAERVVNLL